MAVVVFIIASGIVAAAVWFLADFLRKRWIFVSLIDKIPGPPAIPLLGNTHMLKLDRVEFSIQLEQIGKTFAKEGVGRLWIGPYPLVIFTTSQAAEPILSSNRLITKSNNYNILIQWLGTGLLTSTGDKWKSRRKMLTPTFHFSILNGFIDVFNEQAKVLCECLYKMADSQESFDIFPYIGRAALDIICETSMGCNTVNAQRQLDSEYVRSVKRMSELMFKYERFPWLWPKPLFYLSGYGFEFDRLLKILKDFTLKVITDRISDLQSQANAQGVTLEELQEKMSGKRLAFLDLLIFMKDKNKLTLEDIREEVDTFMFEGHDTTSSGMGWTLFLLGHHPAVQDKIYEELSTVLGDNDKPLTSDDLKSVKYLSAVIKEGLRLYPPVPLFARTVTEDFESAGYIVPAGSTATVVPMMIHRNPKMWDDPDEFKPERFLAENRGEQRDPFAYVPFSAGARNCIGQKFAMMEEKIVLASVLRKYKIVSLETIEKVRPCPDLILRPPEKFLVKLIKRE